GVMEQYEGAWVDAKAREPVPRRGEAHMVQGDGASVDVDRMVRAFDLGLKDLLPVWEQIMPESTLAQLYPLALLSAGEFKLSPRLWTRIVSDFAVAYREQRLPREHLLKALTPLSLGRVAAFIVHTRATPPARLAKVFAAIDRAFEDEKEHLMARWR